MKVTAKKAIDKVLFNLTPNYFKETNPPDDTLLPMIIIMESDKVVNR